MGFVSSTEAASNRTCESSRFGAGLWSHSRTDHHTGYAGCVGILVYNASMEHFFQHPYKSWFRSSLYYESVGQIKRIEKPLILQLIENPKDSSFGLAARLQGWEMRAREQAVQLFSLKGTFLSNAHKEGQDLPVSAVTRARLLYSTHSMICTLKAYHQPTCTWSGFWVEICKQRGHCLPACHLL